MTLSTWPGVPPPSSRSSSFWQACREPCATTWTRPSGLLDANPVSPSSNARERVHQRKPTPWTWPCTHAVSRTSANSCIIDLKSHFGTGLQCAAHGADLIDGPLDNREYPHPFAVRQTGQVEFHALLEQWVALLFTIGPAGHLDGGRIILAEPTL